MEVEENAQLQLSSFYTVAFRAKAREQKELISPAAVF